MKKQSNYHVVVLDLVVVLCYVMVVFGIVGVWLNLPIRRVDTESEIIQAQDLEDLDPHIGIEEIDEGGLPQGIEYGVSFLQYDQQGAYEKLKTSTHEVGDDYESYSVGLWVKNNTTEDLSGMKLFLKLPESFDERYVVADEVTLTVQLEYDGDVARKQLNLVGRDLPIEVAFPVGSAAGTIMKGDEEGVTLPVYDDGSPVYEADSDLVIAEYWRDEGFDLDVPAGEEWILFVSVCARRVANFGVETKIASMNGVYAGRTLSIGTISETEKFHVTTEVANLTDVDQPVKYSAMFDSGVELISGSVRVDGKQIEDFELRDQRDDYKTFNPVELGTNSGRDILTLEYDVEIEGLRVEAGKKTSFIRSSVSVDTMTVGTAVGCRVYVVSIVTLVLRTLLVMISVVVLIQSYSDIIRSIRY